MMLLLKKIMAKTLSSVKKRKEEITSFPRVKKGVEPYCFFSKKKKGVRICVVIKAPISSMEEGDVI